MALSTLETVIRMDWFRIVIGAESLGHAKQNNLYRFISKV